MTRLLGFGLKEDCPDQNGIGGCSDNDSAGEIRGLSNLYCPQEDSAAHIQDVADVLFEMGKISADHLSEVKRAQREKPSCDITQIIKELKLAGEAEISMAKARLYGFEFCQVEPEQIDREVFDKLELNYIKSNRIMPVAMQGETLVVATSRPGDLFIIGDVKRQTHMNIEVVVCLDEDINKVCDAFDEEKIDYCVCLPFKKSWSGNAWS